MVLKISLKRQWQRVLSQGWLAHFEAAATEHFAASDLLAVGSRETNLNEKYQRVPGDNGNGFSIMQIDRRSHRRFVLSGDWKDVGKAVRYAAGLLEANYVWLTDYAGERVSVTDSKGNRRSFVMPDFSDEEKRRIAIAMYNGGEWVVSNAAPGLGYWPYKGVDYSTTGRDYMKDVLARAAVFQSLLDQNRKPTEPVTKPKAEAEIAPAVETPTGQAAATGPPKPSEEVKPAEASSFKAAEALAQASTVPGLKDCAKGFLSLLFGGWKRVSTWITAGVSLEWIPPAVIGLILLGLLVWFIVYTIKARKKAKG